MLIGTIYGKRSPGKFGALVRHRDAFAESAIFTESVYRDENSSKVEGHVARGGGPWGLEPPSPKFRFFTENSDGTKK